MTDPTPETAPRMHAAANESIEAMFKQGCAMEVELAACQSGNRSLAASLNEARSQTSKVAKLLAWQPPYQASLDVRLEAVISSRDCAIKERDALLAAANRILPFLPDMEPVGAAKYAESNLAAWEFRQLLKTFVR